MNPPLACPTCAETLVVEDEATFRCEEDHHYTVMGLALATNIAALNAIWLAIRALEADGASLHHLAGHLHGDLLGISAEQRRTEADAAYAAALMLRGHAQRAQQRLDALPVAPSALSEPGSQRGRGG